MSDRWFLRPNAGLGLFVVAELLLVEPSPESVAFFLPLVAFAVGWALRPAPFLLLGGRDRDESLKCWVRVAREADAVLLELEDAEDEEVKNPVGKGGRRCACCRRASSRCIGVWLLYLLSSVDDGGWMGEVPVV